MLRLTSRGRLLSNDVFGRFHRGWGVGAGAQSDFGGVIYIVPVAAWSEN